MGICIFHYILKYKYTIIFENLHIKYAKLFPDNKFCPTLKRIWFVYIFNGVWTLSDLSVSSDQKLFFC